MSDIVKNLRVNARNDLQSDYVFIRYMETNSVNGQTWTAIANDFYPMPLPTDAISQFNGLRFTVDLQGLNATSTTAKLVCEPIDLTDPAWWLARHDQLSGANAASADFANNPIASVAFIPESFERAPTNSGETDLGFTNELTDGELTDWMPYQSQRITVACKVNITHRNGSVTLNHPLIYKFKATNAVTGTYTDVQTAAQPEPTPVGLAEKLFEAVSVLQFEGELTLQEEDVSGKLGIGTLFNLSGGALAEWATMNAQVQRVVENIDTGETTISFGPNKHLGAGELVDLLRVNRNRDLKYNVYFSLAGTAGGGGRVQLGKNGPEKNSSSTVGFAQTHVVSASIDGTGQLIQGFSGVDPADFSLNAYTIWSPTGPIDRTQQAPAGSVTISLNDAAGHTMKIQPVHVCQNGVPGTIYFLCSDFIAD